MNRASAPTPKPAPAWADQASSLVALAVAMSWRDPKALDAALSARVDAVATGLDQALVYTDELILQSLLFLGFPAALTSLARFRALLEEAGLSTAAHEEAREAREARAGASFEARGEAICRAVYGSAYEKLRGNMQALHPAIERWMLQDGYGKVLGRSALPLGLRELCNVGILSATYWPEQLHSHLRGALQLGVPGALVEAALMQGAARLDAEKQAGLLARFQALTKR